jgi:hypothetical protein
MGGGRGKRIRPQDDSLNYKSEKHKNINGRKFLPFGSPGFCPAIFIFLFARALHSAQTPLRRSNTDRSVLDENELPTSLDAFQTGRLSRSIEVPYYEHQRRNLTFQATWLGSLFQKNHGVRIYDIGLLIRLVVWSGQRNLPDVNRSSRRLGLD